MNLSRPAFIFACIFGLSGCGLTVPDKELLSSDNYVPGAPSPQGLKENRIVGHIRCEVRNGVAEALKLGPSLAWLRDWGATITLDLSVDELGSISPGFSWLHP